MKKDYTKLLKKKDIKEILGEAGVELVPGEKIIRGKDSILCKCILAEENLNFSYMNKDLLEEYEEQLISLKLGDRSVEYLEGDFNIAISNFVVWTGSFFDKQEKTRALKMTKKLIDILSAKDPQYLDDFKQNLEKQEDENC